MVNTPIEYFYPSTIQQNKAGVSIKNSNYMQVTFENADGYQSNSVTLTWGRNSSGVVSTTLSSRGPHWFNRAQSITTMASVNTPYSGGCMILFNMVTVIGTKNGQVYYDGNPNTPLALLLDCDTVSFTPNRTFEPGHLSMSSFWISLKFSP